MKCNIKIITVLLISLALVLAIPAFAQEFTETTPTVPSPGVTPGAPGTIPSTAPAFPAEEVGGVTVTAANGIKIISGGCSEKSDQFQDFFKIFDGNFLTSYSFNPAKTRGRCQITFGGPWSSGRSGIKIFSINMNQPITLESVNGKAYNKPIASGGEILLDNYNSTIDFVFTYNGALQFNEITLPNDLQMDFTNITPAGTVSGTTSKTINITAGETIRLEGKFTEKTMSSSSGTDMNCIARYKGACKPSITLQIYPLLLHMTNADGTPASGQSIANKIDTICAGLRLTHIGIYVGNAEVVEPKSLTDQNQQQITQSAVDEKLNSLMTDIVDTAKTECKSCITTACSPVCSSKNFLGCAACYNDIPDSCNPKCPSKSAAATLQVETPACVKCVTDVCKTKLSGLISGPCLSDQDPSSNCLICKLAELENTKSSCATTCFGTTPASSPTVTSSRFGDKGKLNTVCNTAIGALLTITSGGQTYYTCQQLKSGTACSASTTTCKTGDTTLTSTDGNTFCCSVSAQAPSPTVSYKPFNLEEEISNAVQQIIPSSGQATAATGAVTISGASKEVFAAGVLLLSTQSGKKIPIANEAFKALGFDDVKWGDEPGMVQAGLGLPALVEISHSGSLEGRWDLYLIPIVDVNGVPDQSYALDGYSIAEDQCKNFNADESFQFNYVLNCVFFTDLKKKLDEERAKRKTDGAVDECSKFGRTANKAGDFKLVDISAAETDCTKLDNDPDGIDTYFFWDSKKGGITTDKKAKSLSISDIESERNGGDKVCCRLNYIPENPSNLCTAKMAEDAKSKLPSATKQIINSDVYKYDLYDVVACKEETATYFKEEAQQEQSQQAKTAPQKTKYKRVASKEEATKACCFPKLESIGLEGEEAQGETAPSTSIIIKNPKSSSQSPMIEQNPLSLILPGIAAAAQQNPVAEIAVTGTGCRKISGDWTGICSTNGNVNTNSGQMPCSSLGGRTAKTRNCDQCCVLKETAQASGFNIAGAGSLSIGISSQICDKPDQYAICKQRVEKCLQNQGTGSCGNGCLRCMVGIGTVFAGRITTAAECKALCGGEPLNSKFCRVTATTITPSKSGIAYSKRWGGGTNAEAIYDTVHDQCYNCGGMLYSYGGKAWPTTSKKILEEKSGDEAAFEQCQKTGGRGGVLFKVNLNTNMYDSDSATHVCCTSGMRTSILTPFQENLLDKEAISPLKGLDCSRAVEKEVIDGVLAQCLYNGKIVYGFTGGVLIQTTPLGGETGIPIIINFVDESGKQIPNGDAPSILDTNYNVLCTVMKCGITGRKVVKIGGDDLTRTYKVTGHVSAPAVKKTAPASGSRGRVTQGRDGQEGTVNFGGSQAESPSVEMVPKAAVPEESGSDNAITGNFVLAQFGIAQAAGGTVRGILCSNARGICIKQDNTVGQSGQSCGQLGGTPITTDICKGVGKNDNNCCVPSAAAAVVAKETKSCKVLFPDSKKNLKCVMGTAELCKKGGESHTVACVNSDGNPGVACCEVWENPTSEIPRNVAASGNKCAYAFGGQYDMCTASKNACGVGKPIIDLNTYSSSCAAGGVGFYCCSRPDISNGCYDKSAVDKCVTSPGGTFKEQVPRNDYNCPQDKPYYCDTICSDEQGYTCVSTSDINDKCETNNGVIQVLGSNLEQSKCYAKNSFTGRNKICCKKKAAVAGKNCAREDLFNAAAPDSGWAPRVWRSLGTCEGNLCPGGSYEGQGVCSRKLIWPASESDWINNVCMSGANIGRIEGFNLIPVCKLDLDCCKKWWSAFVKAIYCAKTPCPAAPSPTITMNPLEAILAGDEGISGSMGDASPSPNSPEKEIVAPVRNAAPDFSIIPLGFGVARAQAELGTAVGVAAIGYGAQTWSGGKLLEMDKNLYGLISFSGLLLMLNNQIREIKDTSKSYVIWQKDIASQCMPSGQGTCGYIPGPKSWRRQDIITYSTGESGSCDYMTAQLPVVNKSAAMTVTVYDINGNAVDVETDNNVTADGKFWTEFRILNPGTYTAVVEGFGSYARYRISVAAQSYGEPNITVVPAAACVAHGESKNYTLYINDTGVRSTNISYNISLTDENGRKLDEFSDSPDSDIIGFYPNMTNISGTPGTGQRTSNATLMIVPSDDTPDGLHIITANVSNYDFALEQDADFNFTIFNYLNPALTVEGSQYAQKVISPFTYRLRLKNNEPSECGNRTWYIAREFPTGFSGDLYTVGNSRITSNTISAGDAQFNLKLNSPTISDFGNYKIYVTAFRMLPESFSNRIVGAITGDLFTVYTSTGSEIGSIDKYSKTYTTLGTGAGFKGIATFDTDDKLYIGQENRIFSTDKALWQPTVIVTGVDARQITVDDLYVYWVEDIGIKKASKTASSQDCSGIKCLIINSTTPGSIKDLDVTESAVFWTEWNGSADNTSVNAANNDGSGEYTIFDNKVGLYGITTALHRVITATKDDRYRRVQNQVSGQVYAVTDAKINDIYSDGIDTYWASDNRIERIDTSEDTGVTSATAELSYNYGIEPPTITVANKTGLAGAPLTYDITIKNNAQTTLRFNFSVNPNFDATGWRFDGALDPSTRFIADSIAGGDSKTLHLSVTSNMTAVPNDYVITLADPKIDVIKTFKYTVGVHNSPDVSISPKTVNSITGRDVSFTVSVTNHDPTSVGQGLFNISYNVSGSGGLTADLPQGKTATIDSGTTVSRTLVITVPSMIENGVHGFTVKACFNGTDTCSQDSASVNVSTCGNNICDVEIGETGSIACDQDCIGHDDKIICSFLVPGYNTYQCDKNTSTGIIFNATSLDAMLTPVSAKFVACKRGSDVSACKAAYVANGCGQGNACLAGASAIPLAQNNLSMRCMDDNNGNPEYYYLIYYGTDFSGAQQDYNTPNYSYSCPFYNLSGLRTKRNEMISRAAYLDSLRQIVIAQIGQTYGAQGCADNLTYLITKANSLQADIQAVVDNPSLDKSVSMFNNLTAFDATQKNLMDTYCIETGVLSITGVTLPGTYLGERKIISTNVTNSVVPARDFNVIVKCFVDANGSAVSYESGCTYVPKNSSVTINTNEFILDRTGAWKLKNCTPFTYSTDIGSNQCPAEGQLTRALGAYVGLPTDVFNVVPAPVTVHIDSISNYDLMTGTKLIRVTAVPDDNGLPDVKIGFNGNCDTFGMNKTANANEWIYYWNTLTQADGTINICSQATHKGITVYTNTTVVIDNYDFTISPTEFAARLPPGNDSTYEISLTNLRVDDTFSLSVSENRAWNSRLNETSFTLGQNSDRRILLTTTPIASDVDTTDSITISAVSRAGTKTAKFSLRATVPANRPPFVADISAMPNPVEKGSTINFTANIQQFVGESGGVTDARICRSSSRADCLSSVNNYCILSQDATSQKWKCGYNTVNMQTGTYNYYVYLEDDNGNYQVQGPWSFTVKNARTVRITAPTGTVRGNTTIKADVYIANPSMVSLAIGTDPNCNVVWSKTMTKIGTMQTYQYIWNSHELANGDYYICVKAGDGADDRSSAPITVQNGDFDLNPAQTIGSLRPGNTIYLNFTLRNRDILSTTFTIDNSASIVSGASSRFNVTKNIGSASALTNTPMFVTVAAGDTVKIQNTIVVPSDAKFGDSVTLTVSASSSDLSKQSISTITIGSDNQAPVASNFSASKSEARTGDTVTFTVSGLSDPEGDAITLTKVCTGNFVICDELCTLQGGSASRSCSITTSMVPKNYSWYMLIGDDKGASNIYGPRLLNVLGPADADQTCAYQWTSTCNDDAIRCTQGISHGTGDRGICCEQKPVDCVDNTCRISVESKNCVYQGDKYLASASVVWNNGNSAKASIGGTQSDAHSDSSFTFSRLVDSGTSAIEATVYDGAGRALCSARDSVTCSFQLPDKNTPSGVESIAIKNVKVSTETDGREGIRAADKDLSTDWLSRPGSPQWIWLDLGQVSKVRGIGIYSLYARPRSIEIRVSTDNNAYSTVKAVSSLRYDSNNWAKVIFPDTDMRYINVTILDSDADATAIQQIEVYPAIIVEQPGGFGIGADIQTIAIMASIAAVAVGAVVFVFRGKISRYLEYLTAR